MSAKAASFIELPTGAASYATRRRRGTPDALLTTAVYLAVVVAPRRPTTSRRASSSTREGYVAENGVALCRRPGGCHERAEAALHVADEPEFEPEFTPENLYRIIGSSRIAAERASRKLAAGTD